MNYFSFEELCITDDPVPQEVATKLLEYHIIPMNKVRELLNRPITASQRSGYRPKAYELSKGRSGNSQHTFQHLGAVDWTAGNIDKLLELMIRYTDYTRIAYYPVNHFIHADYKGNTRMLFTSTPDSRWTFVRYL